MFKHLIGGSLAAALLPLFVGCHARVLEVSNGSDLSYNRYGGMIQEYYIQKFRAANVERKQHLAQVKTKEAAEQYIAEVRRKLQHCFGKFPQRTPLNARITGQLTTDKLLIDKVVFESRPGLPVTGLFYRLKDTSRPRPGILALCGHSTDGKGAPWYQNLAQSLALRGYGVLMVDPIGQGERLMADQNGKRIVSVGAHNMLGKSLQLLGENFSMWRLWDAMRSLDYLLSRPEIDPAHIGVTGTSGGGTMSTFLNAFDTRLTMAAPSCYITTQRHNLENEIPADSEQNPPHFLAMGLDTIDMVIAAAPRPTLILAQDNDFFDPRGTREAYAEAKRIYTLLGKPGNLQLYTGHGDHGYSAEHREMAGKFFNKWTGFQTNYPEPKNHQPFPFEQVSCCPEQQRLCGNAAFTVLERQLAALPARSTKSKAQLARDLAQVLQLAAPQLPYYRVLRPEVHILNAQNWKLEKFFNRLGLETEPGILAVLKQFAGVQKLSYFPKFQSEAMLFIPHLTASAELHMLKISPRKNCDLLALEVRGIGETRPSETSFWEQNFFSEYGADFLYASCGLMLDQCYLGRKVYDLRCAIKFLQAHGVTKIHLIGNSQGAIVAALAALYEPAVCDVQLYNAPRSWRSFVERRFTQWPYSVMPFGVLQKGDLPEIYQAIGAKLIAPKTEPLPDFQARQIVKQ